MNIYFHHVGQEGSARDFPKTVFSPVPIKSIESSLPNSIPGRQDFLKELFDSFPGGFVNAWGVPQGAGSVVRRLRRGDVVLLVETTTADGRVPALCEVRLFWRVPLQELSETLWGEHRFPYIFFFQTED